MKKEKIKIKKTRTLTNEECALSKKLYPYARKKFYARLMAGEDSDKVMAWAEKKIAHRDHEIDVLHDVWEALAVCEKNKLPDIDDLRQALQVSLEADKNTYERQINLMVPLFYERKPENYEKEFKKISYHFIDEMAEKIGIFNGNMLSYLFFGDYFTVATGILLAKHADALHPISSVCRMRLNTMLMLLAQKQEIISENAEQIAIQLFEKSLQRPLLREEISLMIIYSLMQIYSWELVDTHQTPTVFSASTKKIEEAITYCESNGFLRLSQWDIALTLTDSRGLWDRQTALITKWLMHIRLNEYSELKAITYRFILKSFQYGYLSSEIIDFIFDGTIFSNASTVVLALSANKLKEHNLSAYLQEKLSQMMRYLIEQDWIDCPEEEIASYLLTMALNRNLHKEETAILNLYVLKHAFK